MRVDETRLAEIKAHPEKATEADRALLTLDVLDDIRRLRADVADLEGLMRKIARQEVASLCGLALARFDDAALAEDARTLESKLRSIFGEGLRDFGGTTDEPGQESA